MSRSIVHLAVRLGVERPRALGRAEHSGERRGDRRDCGGEKHARCARDRVAKMFICALNMPVNTHTCTSYSARRRIGGVLDDVAKGASAAAAGRAPTAKSSIARAVQVVKVPQP